MAKDFKIISTSGHTWYTKATPDLNPSDGKD